jgi:CubicO group peptidase (beta-lactamase class C family)
MCPEKNPRPQSTFMGNLLHSVAPIARVAALGFMGGFVSASSLAMESAAPVEERIRHVEAGLLPAVVIKGDASPAQPLTERMKFYRVPGVSVAVVSGGKIDWARGFGVKDVSTSEPLTTETLFQAGSISKPVAALAALRLVQDGRLSLDQNVNERLVSWKVPENRFTRKEKVTLRRLLTHSAGTTIHGYPGYSADARVPTLAQILDGKKPAHPAPIRVDTVPGTKWIYSGGGYTDHAANADRSREATIPTPHETARVRPGWHEPQHLRPAPRSLARGGGGDGA